MLQADLLVAEQSLEYGDITLTQIYKDLANIEEKFNDSDHGDDAQDRFEAETVALKEERNTMIEQIEDAITRVKRLRAELSKLGSTPYSGEYTKEMKTLGARLSLLHRLSEVPGFSSQNGFTLKTLENHAELSAHFKKKADACKKQGNIKEFISSLAAHYFYAMAKNMLKESLQ